MDKSCLAPSITSAAAVMTIVRVSIAISTTVRGFDCDSSSSHP